MSYLSTYISYNINNIILLLFFLFVLIFNGLKLSLLYLNNIKIKYLFTKFKSIFLLPRTLRYKRKIYFINIFKGFWFNWSFFQTFYHTFS